MKVLLSGYACNPKLGSEAGAGWAWAVAASRAGHDVWVITRPKHRLAIEKALAADPDLKIQVHCHDIIRAKRIKRLPFGLYPYYFLWQRGVRRLARELHNEISFDVAHHVTFASDWLPAGVIGIPNLPSVWGPVGGSGLPPLGVWRWFGFRGICLEVVRALVGAASRRMFGYRLAGSATVMVAQNHWTKVKYSSRARTVFVEPNIAIDPDLISRPAPSREDESELTLLFVGRFVYWKGAYLSIAALRRMSDEWVLNMYGDGPELQRLQRAVVRLGLQKRVTIHQSVDRLQVLEIIRQADALVLPSAHDSAGWVLGEAAMLGTPAIALDIAGPSTVLSEMGRRPVAIGPDLPGRIAAAIQAAIAEDRPPSQRWSSDRLIEFVDFLYLTAMESRHGR